MDDDAVAIGRILRAHGVHGECSAELFGESLFQVELPWEVVLNKDPGATLNSRITGLRETVKDRVLLMLEGIETREDAKKWQGAFISVKETELPPLDKNELREYELVGASLIDSKGKALGTVTEVFPAGHETVLGIKTESTDEVLLPFNKQFISSFKRESGQLIVKLKASMDWEKYLKQEE